METLLSYVAPPSSCGYLPDQTWRLQYEMVADVSPAEYQERLRQGWRRFGDLLFRPRCPACNACRSLRVLVDQFRPDRSQRRAHKANAGIVQLRIGLPAVSRTKLRLYDRYHAFQSSHKGWAEHPAKDSESYLTSFVHNPIPTEEWCYYLGEQLLGVGYVDNLPAGLSAIYFFYDPDERARCLGTWNVLNVLNQAHVRGLPHVYLGYYVPGCKSLEYKARFVPNQVLGPGGAWQPFRE